MSAKLLYNLSDENPNLNKQFGCMNGIFQVFYRQHPARRVVVAGDELKSLPSGKRIENVGTNVTMDNKETEKSKKKKAAKEKQRGVSSESSSRLSFSSSPCSSSFSSADISTTTSQFEQPGLMQKSNGENPVIGGLMMSSDLRELVRNSIHKETRTRDAEEEALSQQPRSARANVSLLKDSSPARNSNVWSEGRRVVKLKDSPRFSYDERETRKTSAKFKETPRLSLDSRSNRSTSSPEPQELVTGHRRTTSSVVAKLMGLEVIPDESVTDKGRENRFCDSPRPTSRVDTDLQRSRSSEPIKKMMPAKFPMKAAPWTQVDGAKNQVKAVDAATTLTVYGEIQKRLSLLEFNKSEKDLTALKQILEAMEKTQQTISKEDDNNSLVPSATTSLSSKNFRSSSVVVMKAATASAFKETGNYGSASSSPRSVTLPNVKVSNLRQSQRVTPRKQSAMDVTPRPGFYKNQTDSATKNTGPRQLQSKNEMAKSRKSQKPSVSPRTQTKKLGFEKQARPTSPKPEQNKIQRQQLNRQQTESASPRRKQGIKSRGMQQSEDRSDESNDLRSLRSDSNVSSASNLDSEVTSRYKYERNSDFTEQHTPKQRSPELGMRSLPKPVKVTVEQPSPVSVLDVAFDEDESPSPVRKMSVVFKDDDHIRSEESQWMNKHSTLRRSIVWPESNVSLNQSDGELYEGIMEEGTESNSGDHKYISEILLASGLLRDIDYSMLSIQLHQAHLPINPSLFFVLEQNKTSNATQHDNKHRGIGFGQQQTANLIERSRRKLVFDTTNEILARKLAAEGCTKQPYITSSISQLRATNKSSKGKELLETMCSEIDRLQDNSKCILDEDDEDLIWEDLQSQGMNWKEIEGETPGLVLDIERLIFKDLISEVVTSGVAASLGMLSGKPRQLFNCEYA